MKLFPFTAFLAAFLAAIPAFAATQWTVEPNPKTITWQGVANRNEVFTGACTAFDASVAFDPADLKGSSVKVTIDMNSCRTGDSEKDAQLPQQDWFHVKLFPQSVFEAKSFTHQGGNEYVAEGSLTMKGVTQKVTLPFTLDIESGKDGEGDKAHVVGETTLKRLAFGVGSGAQFSSPDVAGPDVIVRIDLKAVKSAP